MLQFLSCVSGMFAGSWTVSYSQNSICALEGSSVNMSCSYYYTGNLTGLEVGIRWITIQKYYPHVHETCRSQNKTCYLHVHTVKHSDSTDYYCEINANGTQKWLGQPGVKLSSTGKLCTVIHILGHPRFQIGVCFMKA